MEDSHDHGEHHPGGPEHAPRRLHDHDHDHEHKHHHGHDDDHRHQAGGGLRSLLRPHRHDPADAFDGVLESSRDGIRALRLSLIVLGATATLQAAVVAFSGSVALLSDTIHNGADALTAVPLAIAFILGRRAATGRYTYGFGRSEDVAGIVIVATIAASCGFACWEAADRLLHPQRVHAVGWVIAAGVVGFAGNEAAARFRLRTGRRIGSAALVADGMHARTDGFTSLAVVTGATGTALGWRAADPVAGIVITIAILAVVKNAARDIYRRLMDAVDPALVRRVAAILETSEGICSVDAVRIRWVGHQLHAEAEVTSEGTLSLAAAHELAERAHHELLHQIPRLARATIHTSPALLGDADPHALTAHHFAPPARP